MAHDDGCYCFFYVLVYAVVLLAILLTVAKSQVFEYGIMGIVDLLAAAARLQIDLDADVVNRHSLQAETDNLDIARVFFAEVGQKLDLQFLFGRFRAEIVQHLIFY